MRTQTDLLLDFETFLCYLEAKPGLALTGAGELKGADLYALNERVNIQSSYAVTPRSRKADFPLLAFLFEVVTASRLAVVQHGKVNTLSLVAERVEAYRELTEEEKYVFLLETAWCYVDWVMLESSEGRGGYGAIWFQQGFREVLQHPVGTPVTLYDSRDGKPAPPALFVPFMANTFIRAGKWFGWYDLREIPQPKRDKYSLSFDQLTLTGWGQQCLSVLLHERPFQRWNKQAGESLFFVNESADEEPESVDVNTFAEPFRTLLDEPELLSLYPINPNADKGVFWLSVELPNHQVSRTIAMPVSMTLDDLHAEIQNAFRFDNDHLYHFYLNPRNPYSGERYVCPDEADWSDYPTADSVTLAQLNLYVGQRLLYVFDLADRWEFWITVIRHLPDEVTAEAAIIEKVGRAPKQYE